MADTPAERLAKMPNHQCGRCTSEWGGLGSSERCICGPNVPCGHCGQGMAPAVPDPTVEALARLRDARAAHEWPVETDDGLDYSRCTCGAKPPYSPGGSEDGFWWAHHHDEALVHAVAARAAAPDAHEPESGAHEGTPSSRSNGAPMGAPDALRVGLEALAASIEALTGRSSDYDDAIDDVLDLVRALLEDGAQ